MPERKSSIRCTSTYFAAVEPEELFQVEVTVEEILGKKKKIRARNNKASGLFSIHQEL